MKSMSMVVHVKDAPETLEEAQQIIVSLDRRIAHHDKNMVIPVYQKDNYGTMMVYIADADKARIVRKLTGRKTLTVSDTEALKELGFRFVEHMAPGRQI